ncbi:MAG TPA: hypothetical protein VF889_01050 [Bacteroidota bacterium]
MRHQLAIMLLLPIVAVAAFAQDQPSDVQLEATLASGVLHPGDSTDMILKFTPAEGIHLNADPPARVAFDSASVLTPVGELQQVTEEDEGTVYTPEPLHQRVALRPGARPGRYSVGGTVTYFFCSGTEGWCRRKVEHVQLQVTAVARQ